MTFYPLGLDSSFGLAEGQRRPVIVINIAMAGSAKGGGSLFDFSTPSILAWEESAIRAAASQGRLGISPHATTQALQRGVKVKEIPGIILNGSAVEKDLPGNSDSRKPGIAFVGTDASRRRIKVKVGAMRRYIVVTVHPVR